MKTSESDFFQKSKTTFDYDSNATVLDLFEKKVEALSNEAIGRMEMENEKRSPFVTSGVRLGTAALTSRKMGPGEMKQIAKWIRVALDNIENDQTLAKVQEEVRTLTAKFPLYPKWS